MSSYLFLLVLLPHAAYGFQCDRKLDVPFDTFDPTAAYPTSAFLDTTPAAPLTARLAGIRPIPTQHFATGSIYGSGSRRVVHAPFTLQFEDSWVAFGRLFPTSDPAQTTYDYVYSPNRVPFANAKFANLRHNLLGPGQAGMTPFFAFSLASGAVDPNPATTKLRVAALGPFHAQYYLEPVSATVNATARLATGRLHAPVVQGSPFVTVVYDNSAFPLLIHKWAWIAAAFDGWTGHPISAPYQGTKFCFQMGGTTGYVILYFTTNVVLTVYPNSLIVTTPGNQPYTGVIQSTWVGEFALLDQYDPYWGRYATVPELTLCTRTVSGKTEGVIGIDWKPAGTNQAGKLLVVLRPHHKDELVVPNLAVDSVKLDIGLAARGDTWELVEPDLLSNVRPIIPAGVETIPADRLNDLKDALTLDLAAKKVNEELGTVDATDSYTAGLVLFKYLQLCAVAEALGTSNTIHADLFQYTVARLKEKVSAWLNRQNSAAYRFQYDTVFGGLFYDGIVPGDPGADYGYPFYNDHHFHNGYFLLAGAYLGRLDASWLAANKQRLLILARDIANPTVTGDRWFPSHRHKDWWLGHSWATGVIPFAGEIQQESVSEAINAYWAVYLLGQELGLAEMADTGLLLVATEVRAMRHYWHVTKRNEADFPPAFQEASSVGIVFDGALAYNINWNCVPNCYPARHACVLGIIVFPFSALSPTLVEREWMEHTEILWQLALHGVTLSGDQTSTPKCLYCDGLEQRPPPGTPQEPQGCTCCTQDIPPVVTDWAAHTYIALSYHNKSAAAEGYAFTKALTVDDFHTGNSRTNCMFFLAQQ